MLKRLVTICVASFAAAMTALPADMSIEAEIDGLRIEGSERGNERTPANAPCAAQCNSAHARCSSEVRRARQECARYAANQGRQPFETSAADGALFCGYFRRPRNCGPGCELRFAHHYDLCVRAVNNNVAAMRQDCFVQEREAQNFCREELRACEAACKR
jgi:hypothetical protein